VVPHPADNVVHVDFRRRAFATDRSARDLADGAHRAGRCGTCAHWVPSDDPTRPGCCFAHHRLPTTTGCDGCSIWRRRPLVAVS